MPQDSLQELAWGARPGIGRDDYLAAALETLTHSFPADSSGWNSLDTSTGAVELCGTPPEVFGPTAPTQSILGRVHDHPMVTSYLEPHGPGGTRPRRLSDIVSMTELRRTEAYSELLHPFGGEFQLTILTARSGPRAGSCWTFNRATRDFSDMDVERAARVQPLLRMIETTWPLALGTTDADEGLTAREVQILNLMSSGMTARAIAVRLGISRATVSKHLEHVYRKLHCSDRLVAVQRGRELGLVH